MLWMHEDEKEVFDAVDATWLLDALDPTDFLTHLYMQDCSHKDSLLEAIDDCINDLKEVRNKLFHQTSYKAVMLKGKADTYLHSWRISTHDLERALDEVSTEDKVFIREEINRRNEALNNRRNEALNEAGE